MISNNIEMELIEKIEESNFRVRLEGSTIIVKTPFFTSIKTTILENNLNVKAFFGKIERTKAMLLMIPLSIVLIVLTLHDSLFPFVVGTVIAAIIHDLLRWTITSTAIKTIKEKYNELELT